MASQNFAPLWFDTPELMFHIVARNIGVAYDAYSDLSGKSSALNELQNITELASAFDKTSDDAVRAIQKRNPQLSNINPIFVHEVNTPSAALSLATPTERGLAQTLVKAGLPQADLDHEHRSAQLGIITSYVLFGFAATYTDSSNNAINIFVYRGTANASEAYYDIKGWGTNVDCMLPTDSSLGTPSAHGQVQSTLFNFYRSATFATKLSTSTLKAVKAVAAAAPKNPWVSGGHSLGGAIMTVAMLDLVVSKVLDPGNVLTFNYGCLRIGDAEFAKQYNDLTKDATVCVQNMCDFVPSFCGVLAPSPTAPKYAAVGQQKTFLWETGESWGNHSMLNVYTPMVDPDKGLFWMLKPLPAKFPISINPDMLQGA